MRTHVNFTPANKIEAMHEMSNVKVEPLSTSRLSQHFISFLYFKYALKIQVRVHVTVEINPQCGEHGTSELAMRESWRQARRATGGMMGTGAERE